MPDKNKALKSYQENEFLDEMTTKITIQQKN